MTKVHAALLCLLTAFLVVVAGFVLNPKPPVAEWDDQYDHYFRKYSKRYFSVLYDWRWFKAQGAVESSLDPSSVSPRGAVGIMQLLPSTFDEVFEDQWLALTIEQPRWNIAAGIAYNRYLYDKWTERVPADQRLPFTFASYNRGFKGILDVREKARESGVKDNHWDSVSQFANAETHGYVDKIRELMNEEPGTP